LNVSSILVLRGGALGDFLITLPLLKALRKRWPGARIDLAGNSRAAELAALDGTLSAVHDQSELRWAELYSDGPLSTAFRSWLESFDIVLNFWPDPNGEIARRFPLRGGQRYHASSSKVISRPACAHFFTPLEALHLPPPRHARLTLPARFAREAASRLMPDARRVAVHPGSGSARKNWPPSRWLELIERLAPDPILVILGEAEDAVRAEMTALGSDRIQIADTWPLPLLACAIAACRLFVGHDTGIAHLAAACGTPCVLLFGPTDPAVWAPFAPDVTVLRDGDALENVSIDRVLQHVRWD